MGLRSGVRDIGRYDALLLTSLLWFLAKFLRYAFPPLFEPLRSSYGLSNAVVGGAFTAFMIAYAAMQFPSGALADRIGSVKVVVAGAIVASIAAVLVVVESTFLVLVGAMMLMGAGTGAHKTVAVRLLSRAYPARTGRALGILDTFGAFGGVAAPAAVVLFVALPEPFGGWRTLFLAFGLVGLGLAAAFLRRVPRRLPDETEGVKRESTSDRSSLRRYASLFRDRRFATFVAVTILFSFTYYGIVAFFPLYLTSEAGLGSATASLLYSALFAASAVQIATGEVADRIGSLPVITGTLATATIALAAVVVLTPAGGPLALGAAIVAVGVGAHGFRPVRGSYLMAILPTEIAGGSLGVVRTLLMLAGAIAPALVGYASETIGFVPAFWLLTASVGSATVLSAALWLSSSGGEPSVADPSE